MKTSRRPGAKPQGPFEDKRRTLTTRITEGTRVKLEAAARDSTRSLSQEIELRLELSLDRDEGLGGRRTAALLRSLAAMVEPHYDDNYHWLDDRDAFNVVIDRWTQYLKTKAPTRAVADQAQIQSEFDELKKNISEASPSGRLSLKRFAKMLSETGNTLDPEMRAAYAALANEDDL